MLEQIRIFLKGSQVSPTNQQDQVSLRTLTFTPVKQSTPSDVGIVASLFLCVHLLTISYFSCMNTGTSFLSCCAGCFKICKYCKISKSMLERKGYFMWRVTYNPETQSLFGRQTTSGSSRNLLECRI